MTVTVAVPSNGHSPHLSACVRSILTAFDQLSDGMGEAILVLNGPDTGTVHLQVDDPRLQIVTDPEAGAARARNTALDLANNDRVLFTDDDCEVPAGWCRTLSAALNQTPAVAAPVVVQPTNPVASFLDYKRTFVAPPVDDATVRCMVTANCGLRRSVLPDGLRFDDTLFDQAAAEDSALSYLLTDLGIPIRWVAYGALVEHHVQDAPSEIVRRFLRYGRGNARLVNAHGRWQESVPEAWSWFASIRSGSWTDHRHFPELPAPARPVFVACELALTASWLTGYLEEMQHHLGLRIVSVDRPALTAALEAFVGWAASAAANLPWTAPEVEVARLAASGGIEYGDERDDVAAALRATAGIVGCTAETHELVNHLAAHHEPVRREQARIRRQALDEWTRTVIAEPSSDLDRLEAGLRCVGVSLSDGLDEIEKEFSVQRRRLRH